MRQKLATARNSTHLEPSAWPITVIAASARAPQLGLLLSRGLDNLDKAAFRQAVLLLAREMVHSRRWNRSFAIRIAERALLRLENQLCQVCLGRKHVATANGVLAICQPCGGSGRNGYERDAQLEATLAVAMAALRAVTRETKKGLAYETADA